MTKFYLFKGSLLAFGLAAFLLTTSCNKVEESEPIAPFAETLPVVTSLTSTTAQICGEVTGLGSSLSVQATGVCWSSSSQTPTVDGSHTSDGVKEIYTSNITGLTPNTKYYARAYVTTSSGTGYGSVLTFTTSNTTADTTTTVSTFAGNGNEGLVNGLAASAAFNHPQGMAVDANGNLYVSDGFNYVIRKITPAGVVSTYAGSGVLGFAGGTALTARFYSPQGLAIDASGNLYVADQGNHAIYKITTGGTVTILAGTGSAGYTDGAGANAQFNSPQGLAVDASGNLYVADQNNNRIRKITPTGTVSTVSGTANGSQLDGDISLATFLHPSGVAVDAAGNIYVADQGNAAVRKIAVSTGMVSTLVGTNVFASILNSPTGITTDASGNIYLTDRTGRILRITSQNVLYTLAGTAGTHDFADGTNANAAFASPAGIAVDANKNIYVADYDNNRIRKLMVTIR